MSLEDFYDLVPPWVVGFTQVPRRKVTPLHPPTLQDLPPTRESLCPVDFKEL